MYYSKVIDYSQHFNMTKTLMHHIIEHYTVGCAETLLR